MKNFVIIIAVLLAAVLLVSCFNYVNRDLNVVEHHINSPESIVTVYLDEWEPYPLDYYGDIFIQIRNVHVEGKLQSNGETVSNDYDVLIGSFSANNGRTGSNLYFMDQFYSGVVSFYNYPSFFNVVYKDSNNVTHWGQCNEVTFTYDVYDVVVYNQDYCEEVGFKIPV